MDLVRNVEVSYKSKTIVFNYLSLYRQLLSLSVWQLIVLKLYFFFKSFVGRIIARGYEEIFLFDFKRKNVAFVVLLMLAEKILTGFFVFVMRFQIIDLLWHESPPKIALVVSILYFKRIVVKSIQNLESLLHLWISAEWLPTLIAIEVSDIFDFVSWVTRVGWSMIVTRCLICLFNTSLRDDLYLLEPLEFGLVQLKSRKY